MTQQELYHKLEAAYSDANLNRITGKLIELYKNRNLGTIREIVNKISDYIAIDEENDARCFSKLVILYHPDKGESHRNAIKKHFTENDYENLHKYAHILLLHDIDNVKVTAVDEDIDYHPEYGWDDIQYDGSGYFDPFASSDDQVYASVFEGTFYDAVKLRVYGNLNQEFPSYYLEDLEEIELASSNILYLDGVEYCKQVIVLDLSDNEISDISDLWDLYKIEKLYLSNNQLCYIDGISNLFSLRDLDISGNQVDDISPLFELDHLEYVNLIGNTVPENQIEKLKSKGVIVMY
jgi:hypothetical protein